MFFDALEKTKRGAVVCVFDITDRMQHMFWRYLEDGHPRTPARTWRSTATRSATCTGGWTTSSGA